MPADCPICMDHEADSTLTPCNHSICQECAVKIIKPFLTPMCPLCRAPIETLRPNGGGQERFAISIHFMHLIDKLKAFGETRLVE